jgi:hypothetical protein
MSSDLDHWHINATVYKDRVEENTLCLRPGENYPAGKAYTDMAHREIPGPWRLWRGAPGEKSTEQQSKSCEEDYRHE